MKAYSTNFGISGNLLNLIKHYLTDRFQRVLLVSAQSGSLFFWVFLKETFWDLRFFNICINEDTCLFSVNKNKEESGSNLTNDVDAISTWACLPGKCHSIQTPKNSRNRFCSLEI